MIIPNHSRYDISPQGVVTNINTGLVLKHSRFKTVGLHDDALEKMRMLSISTLLTMCFPIKLDENLRWTALLDYRGYLVSCTGKIMGRQNGILKPTNVDGYEYVYIDSRTCAVHILVALAFLGPCPAGMTVNHIDLNKSNNHVSNLEYRTFSGQMQHAVSMGRIKTRPVIRTNCTTGDESVFTSTKGAARDLKICENTIRYWCTNGTVGKGCKWRFGSDAMKSVRIAKPDVLWKRLGKYDISSCGLIWSRHTKNLMKPSGRSYKYVKLVLPSGAKKNFRVNRLVATQFVPNVLGLPQVDHIDKNRRNNHFTNLRWVTAKQNSKHARAKPINQLSMDGQFIKRWEAAVDIDLVGVHRSAISRAVRDDSVCGGFRWQYANEADLRERHELDA